MEFCLILGMFLMNDFRFFKKKFSHRIITLALNECVGNGFYKSLD